MLFSVGLSLISSKTSRPSFLGRFRSSKTRSGRGTLAYSPSCLRKAIAFAPSEATCKLMYILASLNASRVSRTSPGLSSTKRITIGSACVAFDFIVSHFFGQGKVEGRAFSGLRLDPDPSTQLVQNLFANG